MVYATTTSTLLSSFFHAGNLISADRRPRNLSFSPLHRLNSLRPDGNRYNSSLLTSSLNSSMAIGSNESEKDTRFLQNGREEDTPLHNESEEDTDEMYDDLLQNYGEVVYKSNDKKSPLAEVDDDAECLSFAVAVAKVASDVKAGDIKVLFVKPLVNWTRFFIIATAFSRPQVDAIGSRVKDLAENKYGKFAKGDFKPNSWTLLDFGDVVLHIFLPEQRAFYNLEEFYANATSIDLPFENQPPFQG